MREFFTWVRTVKPGTPLKWGGVILAYAIAVLFIINVVIATFEAHS